MVFLWFLSIEYRETLVFHIESFLVVFWTKSSFLSLYFYFLINLVNEANPFPNWSYKFEIIFILTLRLFFLNVDLNKFVIFSDICGWWTMRRGGPSPLTPPPWARLCRNTKPYISRWRSRANLHNTNVKDCQLSLKYSRGMSHSPKDPLKE